MRKSIVGLLMTSLIVMSTAITTQVKALAPPSWVPTAVGDWNLAYNNSITLPIGGDFDLGSDTVKSNWTQLWYKNTTTALTGIIGVITVEYKEDYFSKALDASIKNAINTYGPSLGLPAFEGSTVWDFFKWIMGLVATSGGTALVDETANVAGGADGAFSLNFTAFGDGSFYLLYAYKGPIALMVFAMAFNWDFSEWITLVNEHAEAIATWYQTYVAYLALIFAVVMTAVAGLGFTPSSAAIPAIADITPTAGVETTSADVKTFAKAYVTQLPGGSGIPGFPVVLLAIASFFAVFVIVRKRKVKVA